MHTVSQLLEAKPFKIVYTVGQGRSVLEAAELMNQHRIGALVVTAAGVAFTVLGLVGGAGDGPLTAESR